MKHTEKQKKNRQKEDTENMAKKERIEDLGKLSVMLDELYRDEIFDSAYCRRAKDAWQSFSSLNDDEKQDCITSLAYGLERIKDRISVCCCIADGEED